MSTERDVYMAHVNWAGAVFVKTLDFFRRQGGFREKWGECWVPVIATGIEDARDKIRGRTPRALAAAVDTSPPNANAESES